MKERPILFSGPMVRAILSGAKTQTRRVIKPQPVYLTDFWTPMWGWKEDTIMGGYDVSWCADAPPEAIVEFCPYGKTGDQLWVRETHLVTAGGAVLYKADHPDLISGYCRPSIHMLRQHSRITLEVTSVRVQRIRDISHQDGRAEVFDSLDGFALLWDRINAKRGYGWHANPWVWAVEFRAVKA